MVAFIFVYSFVKWVHFLIWSCQQCVSPKRPRPYVPQTTRRMSVSVSVSVSANLHGNLIPYKVWVCACMPAAVNWTEILAHGQKVMSSLPSEGVGSLNTLRAEWSTQLPEVKYHCRLTSHRPLDNMIAWRAATDQLAGYGGTAALATRKQRAATYQLAGYGGTAALASRKQRAATDQLGGYGGTAALASRQQRAAADQLAGYGSTTALASRQQRAVSAALGASCNDSYSYCVLGCDAAGCGGYRRFAKTYCVHVDGGSYKIIHRHYLHGVSRSNPHIHFKGTRKPHEPHEVATCQLQGLLRCNKLCAPRMFRSEPERPQATPCVLECRGIL